MTFGLKVQKHCMFIITAFWLLWLSISYLARVVSLRELEDQLMTNWGGSGDGLI